jgi:hypothetical protein
MSRQTAVEWLVIKFKEIVKVFDIDENQLILLLDAIKTSKEMEKEQIKEAHGAKQYHKTINGEQYYNETYKKEDK